MRSLRQWWRPSRPADGQSYPIPPDSSRNAFSQRSACAGDRSRTWLRPGRAVSCADACGVQSTSGAGTMPQTWRPQSRARSDARPATDPLRRPPSARSADRRFLRTLAYGRAVWTATSSRTVFGRGAPGRTRIVVVARLTQERGLTSATSPSLTMRVPVGRAARTDLDEMRSSRDRSLPDQRPVPRRPRPVPTSHATSMTGSADRRWTIDRLPRRRSR